MVNLQKVKVVAEEVSRKIGQRMREISLSNDTPVVNFKGATDVVTETDIWAEEQIKQAVHENFPNHLVIGEETSSALIASSGMSLEENSETGIVWMVDPIDGTANFANRIPHSAISIGVLENSRLVFGLVYDPYLDEMFTAIKGQGAYRNDTLINVGNKQDLINCIVATGFPGDHAKRWDVYSPAHSAFVTKARKVRVLGSSAIELCWVACGRLDGFYEYHLHPWDMAGGALVLEEAGGQAGCFLKPEEKFSIFSDSILATNKTLFPTMLKTIKSSC